jgi:hypothetical protein
MRKFRIHAFTAGKPQPVERMCAMRCAVLCALALGLSSQAMGQQSDPEPRVAIPGAAEAPEKLELHAAPRTGAVLRLRQTSDFRAEADGSVILRERRTHDYTLTVGEPVECGGFHATLRVQRATQVLSRGSGDLTLDTGKAMPELPDRDARLAALLLLARTDTDLSVTVGSDGGLVSVRGYREAVEARLKDTDLEAGTRIDAVAGPDASLDAFRGLFARLPCGEHEVGREWTCNVARSVGGVRSQFASKCVLSLPSADTALCKMTLSPREPASAAGYRVEGDGTESILVKREDGLPVSFERRIFVRRSNAKASSEARTTVTIERMTADGESSVAATPKER